MLMKEFGVIGIMKRMESTDQTETMNMRVENSNKFYKKQLSGTSHTNILQIQGLNHWK